MNGVCLFPKEYRMCVHGDGRVFSISFQLIK